MADSILSLLASARGRIVVGQNNTVAGAILSKVDNDVAIQALELVYTRKTQNPSSSLVDWIELAIAARIDAGESYPLGDTNAYRGAQWLAQMDLTKFPNPMPRDFVLYIAMAAVSEGKATSVEQVVKQLISTYQFV